MRIVGAAGPEGFDYVIVGAGSAGSVMAARLGEDPTARILVVEAGGSDKRLGVVMPAAMGLPLLSDATNWKLFSEQEDGRPVYLPRGKLLGGSSSVNGMDWMRGNRQDYGSWQDYGVAGWSFAEVLPFFKKAETFEDGGSQWRGGDGRTKVTRAACDNGLFRAFLDAGIEAGHGFNEDQNGASQTGMHRQQRNIGDGRRMNTSQVYLRKLTGPNVSVITGARVARLTVRAGRCVGATLLVNGRKIDVTATREVILSAGAIMSPQVLMLSGIGPADELRQHGIEVVLDQPEVGQGLSDHTCLSLYWAARDEGMSMHRALSPAGQIAIGAAWVATRRGLGASNWFEAGAMISTDGTGRADIQMECVAMNPYFGHDAIRVGPGFHCSLSLQRPTSKGRVWLQSADPIQVPGFRLGIAKTEYDQKLAVTALRTMRELIAQPSARRVFGSEIGDSADAKTDAEIVSWLRANGESNYHPSCSLAMGRVTDTEGQVKGLDGLRVVDASIFPVIPSANLNAPVIMMAEKIAAGMTRYSSTRERMPLSPL
jgi:choline dehydrogenase